jgi:hypothetical protein
LLAPSLAQAQCTNLSVGQTCVTVDTLRITGTGVYPDHIDIKPTASVNLSFVAKDSAGNNITHHTVIWSISDPTVATVTTGGKLTGLKYGKAVVQLTVGAQAVYTPVLVTPFPATRSCVTGNPCYTVATLKPVPPNVAGDTSDHADAVVGNAYSMGLVAKDSVGRAITGHTVQWFTADTTVMSVSSGGRMLGRKAGLTDLWVRVGLSMYSLPACVASASYVELLTGVSKWHGQIGDTWQGDTVASNATEILLRLTPVRVSTTQTATFRAAEKVSGGSFKERTDRCVHWGTSTVDLRVDRQGNGIYAPTGQPVFPPSNFGVKASLGRTLP